jgi:hypothetical protein
MLKKTELLTQKLIQKDDVATVINKINGHSGNNVNYFILIFNVARWINIDRTKKYTVDTFNYLTYYHKFTFTNDSVLAFKYSKDTNSFINYQVNLFEIE